jgi:putative transposase
VQQFAWRPMPKGLWQRNYYEHIIRNERELEATRAYIRENPTRWDSDPENLS